MESSQYACFEPQKASIDADMISELKTALNTVHPEVSKGERDRHFK